MESLGSKVSRLKYCSQYEIKIYSAGYNIKEIFKAANYKYKLLSVFDFTTDYNLKFKKEILSRQVQAKLIDFNLDDIMIDSGLYSILYGKFKGARDYDYKFFKTYAENYSKVINYMQECLKKKGFKRDVPFVEIDCQIILGRKKADEIYKILRKNVDKKTKILRVFKAKEDSKKVLDKLVEEEDYFCISFDRKLRGSPKNFAKSSLKFLNYIRNKNKKTKIHFLGIATNPKILIHKTVVSSDSIFANAAAMGLTVDMFIPQIGAIKQIMIKDITQKDLWPILSKKIRFLKEAGEKEERVRRAPLGFLALVSRVRLMEYLNKKRKERYELGI